MTLLRLRLVQLMLAALVAATPKPYRRELVACFERLDDEAKALAAREPEPGNPEEVLQ